MSPPEPENRAAAGLFPQQGTDAALGCWGVDNMDWNDARQRSDMQDTDNKTETWLQAQIDTNLKRVYRAPDRKALPDRMERLLNDLRRAEAEHRARPTGSSQPQS